VGGVFYATIGRVQGHFLISFDLGGPDEEHHLIHRKEAVVARFYE
jgi:hypothetical protein